MTSTDQLFGNRQSAAQTPTFQRIELVKKRKSDLLEVLGRRRLIYHCTYTSLTRIFEKAALLVSDFSRLANTQNEFKSTTLTFWPIRITHCISSDDGGSGCGVMSATGGKSRSETRTGSSGSCHATNFALLPKYHKIKPLFHSVRKT